LIKRKTENEDQRERGRDKEVEIMAKNERKIGKRFKKEDG
jgi:hypothetical protein